jgi:hypothetical protein
MIELNSLTARLRLDAMQHSDAEPKHVNFSLRAARSNDGPHSPSGGPLASAQKGPEWSRQLRFLWSSPTTS